MKALRHPLPQLVLMAGLAACSGRGPAVTQPAPTQLPASQSASITPSAGPSATATPSLISQDETWNLYTNPRLGIEMLVPKLTYRWDVGCVWVGGELEGSYRPQGGFVPVIVQEADERVVISGASYAKLTLPTRVPSGAGYHTNFAGCEQREITLEAIAGSMGTSGIWEIWVFPVGSPEDLEAWIDKIFGPCFSLGEMRPLEGRGLMQVQVRGDGKPVEESECLLRGMYVFLYSPDRQRAAAWLTGQSMHFVSDPQTGEGYDSEMYASFKFIP